MLKPIMFVIKQLSIWRMATRYFLIHLTSFLNIRTDLIAIFLTIDEQYKALIKEQPTIDFPETKNNHKSIGNVNSSIERC